MSARGFSVHVPALLLCFILYCCHKEHNKLTDYTSTSLCSIVHWSATENPSSENHCSLSRAYSWFRGIGRCFRAGGLCQTHPRLRLVPLNGTVLVPRVQNYFWNILRPNTHVTFKSYQSLLFLDSKEGLILIEEGSCYKGKKAVGVCSNPNTLNETYDIALI